jgi:hypothetical protein
LQRLQSEGKEEWGENAADASEEWGEGDEEAVNEVAHVGNKKRELDLEDGLESDVHLACR